jgi:hypothetical protein
MGLLDVLARYQSRPNPPPPNVLDDFDRVSNELTADDLAPGLEDAFNDDDTPPFEEMVGQLYERSDDDMRAGLMNEIVNSLGGGQALATGAAGGLFGGVLGDLIRRRQGREAITARDMHNVPAREIERAAAAAKGQNPNIVQTISRFYARHPRLVQGLGQAAISILMSGMARRRRF